MYYVYHIDEVPEELYSKYPNHAIYEEGKLALFGEGSKDAEIDDFIGGIEDEDHMDDLADKATYTGTVKQRKAKREAARKQARIDARKAFRIRLRKAARIADRKEKRLTRRQGRKLYDDQVVTEI